MLRKLVVSAVMGLGVLSPLAAAPAAEAHEYYHRHHEYRVFFRRCDREPWECRGCFERWERAERVACHLRERGFEVFIR
jgi:hypothetical protein